MKRAATFFVSAYLLIGLSLAIRTYSHDLRTFRCESLDAPHGYVTIGTSSYVNPDPERCFRRGAEADSVLSVPFLTVFGAPILAMRAFGES